MEFEFAGTELVEVIRLYAGGETLALGGEGQRSRWAAAVISGDPLESGVGPVQIWEVLALQGGGGLRLDVQLIHGQQQLGLVQAHGGGGDAGKGFLAWQCGCRALGSEGDSQRIAGGQIEAKSEHLLLRGRGESPSFQMRNVHADGGE